MIIRGPLAGIFAAVLLLSVATNLLVAGFVMERLNGPSPGPRSDVERIVSIGIRAFPPEIQNAIADGARAKRDDMRKRIDAVHDARRKMFDAMRADPFDRAALEAAYANLRAKIADLQQVGQEITLNAVANAPADVRQRIGSPQGPPP